MRGDNSSPLPPLEFIGVSNTSSATMSSDDSSYYEERGRDGRSKQRHFENGRSPSPTKGNDRMRKSAATPTVDNRRRKIFPKQNGNSGVHQSKNRLRDRKTKIQVCVRVRPLLPSDQRVTNNLPPVPEEGAKGKRSTGASRHTKLTPTRPMRSRSSSPSMRSSKKDIVDAAPAWTVHNDNISQAPHTNPETSRVNDYTFDNSFGPENSTSDIYHSTVKDSVHSTMDGYHASVFAYGQTATGKTYTMTGSAGMSNMNPDDDSTKGIIQFAIQDCFNYIYNQKTETREYLLRVSFMEIYNEVINDLLAVPTKTAPFMGTSMQAPPPAPSSIRIFESKNEGVIIRGLKEEIVTCPEQVFSLLAAGEKRRQTGATNLNKQSSRSHSIFRLIVESRKRISRMSTSNRTNMSDGSSVADSIASSTFAPESTSGPVRVSTLSLVDLAGSESVKNTKSTGARKKEGQYINKSLLTLGHVVYKLAEISSKSIGGRVVDATHIPYRDSKLTRLLQPSLSGNAQICIICNISPLARHIEESHLTLKFASRAKRIKQHATITESVDEKTMLENYREEIEELKRQLQDAKGASQEQPPNQQQSGSSSVIEALTSPGANDEDTLVLSQAIGNLERLILKTSSAAEKKRRKQRKQRISAQNKSEGQEEILEIPASFSTQAGTNPNDYNDSLLNMLGDKTDDDDDDLLGGMSFNSKDKLTRDKSYFDRDDASFGSMSLGDESTVVEGKRLITELHRIRGLLGNVLERKGTSPPSGMRSPDGGSSVSFVSPSASNEQEVERLRAQLHEQAVTTSLRKADTTFLQSQLQEKDKLLKDVSQLFGAIEKRQVELEAENEKIKQEYSKSIAALKSKESEVVILEKLMKKRETEIKKLKQKK